MIWKNKRKPSRELRPRGEQGLRRRCLPERLEERRLLAADPIHIGIVYIETDYLESDQDVGSDSSPDRFILSFTGGAPNTELTELFISTDKDGDGISVGDLIFDTKPGGLGKGGSHDFKIARIVTTDGRQVQATVEVEDGSQELILRLSNFRAGDRLEFTIDVDEVLRLSPDLDYFNDRLDTIVSGQEFQDSILKATFQAPHYQAALVETIFINEFGDPAREYGLDLPPNEGDHLYSRPNRTAAAIATTRQIPKPISIEGHVWLDSNLNAIREPHEALLADVEVSLWKKDATTGQFVDTSHRAMTDAMGKYRFEKSLALQPGEYRIVQTQPAGLYSVAAVPGTVAGVRTGIAQTPDVITSIVIPLGDLRAIDYDFAEAQPAKLSGFVYQDDNDNGRRDAGEVGIPGVTIQLIPINTIAPQEKLTVTTAADGSYSFTGLVPGSYEVIQVNQPTNWDDGRDSPGTINGVVVGIADDPGDRIHGIDLGGGDVGIEYNFGELPRGALSGFVYLVAPGQDCNGIYDAPGNQPLPGVLVELHTEDGAFVARTTTGTDGSYLFDEVSKGTYRISQVTPTRLLDGKSRVGLIDGLQVGRSVDGGTISEITMTAGAIGTLYNFCEIAPATISGYVYQDDSNDGIRDPGERGIPGTTITLVDAVGRTVAETTTDANGRYEFVDILPGEYAILQTQPDGFFDGIDTPGQIDGKTVGVVGDDGDSIRSILLKQGQTGVEYNFGELVGASLAGRVHADLNGNCVLDPGESPLSDVVIRLVDSAGKEVARTTTDTNGRYQFDDLTPGTYTVIQEQPEGFFEGGAKPGSAGGVVESSNRISKITLRPGEVAVDYDFCEHPPAEIHGLVFGDLNADFRFTPGEPGIDGVLVELFNDAGQLIASTRTDAQGNYHFTFLPAGKYLVRETQPSGWLQGGQFAGSHGGDDSVADVISRIPVGWGERLTDYNFSELLPASISGFVFVDANHDCIRDEDERPLAGVTVELRDDAGQTVQTTTTDSEGRYTFDNLEPGRYEIFEIQPNGFFQGGQSLGDGGGEILGPDWMSLQLLAGRNVTNYNFCELEPSSIGGRVWQEVDLNRTFNPGDIPLPGVLVDLVGQNGQVLQSIRTDVDGRYVFETLAPGVYGVRQHQPSGFFHGGQVIGSLGGRVEQDDFIVGIELKGGTRGWNYDFPEVPPASITGFVFQDGDAIVAHEPPPPENLRDLRDGVFREDNVRLGGVVMELRNVLGQPFDASRALPGTYPDGPIRVMTDEHGFYEFVGLRPGTYHVYQIQPDGFLDGLDTPGTTGGVAVNPADTLDDDVRILIQTLALSEATDPRNDAILNISLGAGQTSLHNNFSEIVITPPPIEFIPFIIPDEPLMEIPEVPIETFDSTIRLVTFASPEQARNPLIADDEWAVSWHLSLINGGFPRGSQLDAAKMEQVGLQQRDPKWTEGEISTGRWQVFDLDGNPVGVAQWMTMGIEGSTALTGDFNGDGKDQAVIYHRGAWYVDINANGYWDAEDLWLQLGTAHDLPVVGDWDGDGKDDIAIFGRQWQRDAQRIVRDPGLPSPDNLRRRSVEVSEMVSRGEDRGEDRERLLRRGSRGELRADAVDHVFQYGESVDVPVAGDWNGDGIDQIGVFRSGTWMLDSDGDGRLTPRDEKIPFGQPGDEPIVGDFNGDGIDQIGVVRGNLWIIDTDGDRQLTENDLHLEIPRPSANSQPVVGDWDGDGIDEIGYYDAA